MALRSSLPPTAFQRRARRVLAAGTWTAVHWRGVLLGLYFGLLGAAAGLSWLGYLHRDQPWGVAVGVIFGLATIAIGMRFPRRLARSMRRKRLSERQPQDTSVIAPLRHRPTIDRD